MLRYWNPGQPMARSYPHPPPTNDASYPFSEDVDNCSSPPRRIPILAMPSMLGEGIAASPAKSRLSMRDIIIVNKEEDIDGRHLSIGPNDTDESRPSMLGEDAAASPAKTRLSMGGVVIVNKEKGIDG